MPGRALPIIAAIGLVLFLAATSFFTVNQAQLALRTEFGAIVTSSYEPGLHVKWPWDVVVAFDRRILTQTYTGETFLTNDNRGLVVDFYIKWRVLDASKFFQATGGSEDIAGRRLAEIVKDGIKSVVAERSLERTVSSERAAVTHEMLDAAKVNVAGLGADLVDVRVQSINLPDEVSTRVYESMKQNFTKIAARLRAEGQSANVRIRAEAERERTEILAAAEREALKVHGEGDAEATGIYARAYSKNPEFYSFFRSLQAYDHSLGKDGDLLVVTPDGEFFKYLKDSDKHPGAPNPGKQ
jgi:membrane protease subunit HflC